MNREKQIEMAFGLLDDLYTRNNIKNLKTKRKKEEYKCN